jgi:hypothetical protein
MRPPVRRLRPVSEREGVVTLHGHTSHMSHLVVTCSSMVTPSQRWIADGAHTAVSNMEGDVTCHTSVAGPAARAGLDTLHYDM